MSNDSERGRYTSPEGSKLWEYIATIICGILIFCVGCVAGWNSPTMAMLTAPNSTNHLSYSDASTLSSMLSLGHTVAPMFTIVMADKLGRKNSLLVSGIPTIICWGLISVTQNIMVLFVARFFGGLSVGLIMCIPPIYLGEIASAKLRGAIGMVTGIMLNVGILFMYVLVPYFSIETMAQISLTIAAIATISIWFVPESPYFLAMVGRLEEAESALEKLRGKTDVTEELDLIKITVNQKNKDDEQETSKKPSSFKQLFSVPGNRKALYITLLFPAVLQFGGYITIMVYGHVIFEKMKTGISPNVCTMIYAVLQLVANVLTIFVVDRLGRRPLIFISGVISGICLLVVATYLYLMEYRMMNVAPYGIFALCAVVVNIISLNIGLMPLQMVVQSEILATDIKGLVSCIVGIGGGIMSTIGVKFYLMVAEAWEFGHSVPFFGFTITTWTCTAVILKLLPETKGKTLYEIQQNMNA